MLTIKEENELVQLLQESQASNAGEDLTSFTYATLPGFHQEPYHREYYQLLNEFAHRRIKRLIVVMPPQHGKSEGSTRRLPAFMLGLNPDAKVAISSYNATIASKFNRDVQRIIDSPEYNEVFPDTKLNEDNVVTVTTNYLRNSTEFEIVGHWGGLRAVGRGGPLTSFTVDVMIMDDLYKDYQEGNSPITRQSVWDWYTSTVKTRLHNASQELMVFTRWHEEDLIGAQIANGKVKQITDVNNLPGVGDDEWLMVNFEAIKESDPTPIDPRPIGTPLWPDKHSLAKHLAARAEDPRKFSCMYQGAPEDRSGQLYGDFKTYKDLPELKIIKSYTDTADTGEDNLCSLVYGVPVGTVDDLLYILGVYYTDEPMEITEPATIKLHNDHGVNRARIESNNGGRSFARVVKGGAKRTHVEWFHQGKNKEARIYSNSAQVTAKIVMPSNWHVIWPEFYNDVTKYKALYKANKHHDAPDCLTGIIETESAPKAKVKSARLVR